MSKAANMPPFDLSEVRAAIEAELSDYPFGSRPAELYEPIRYILSIGGKRMRPILVLLAAQALDDQWYKYLKPAVGLEVFHNFTLMHDDIMDQAPLRRGKPTVHRKWNEHIALLAGDAMLIKTYRFFEDIPDQQYRQAIHMFNRCALEVCEGQQLDMNFEAQTDVSVKAYLEMISLKTAALLGFGLAFGTFLAGGSDPDVRHMEQLGINLGIGFQLKDDLLDVFGDQEKFGKQVGGDIIANKKTYLLLRAIEKAGPAEREILQKWLHKKEFDPIEKVNAIKNIYQKLSIQSDTEKLIDHFHTKAFNELEMMEIKSEKKEFIRVFFEDLLARVS